MIRCIAVDDSSLALDLLEDYIGKIKYLHLAKRCQSAVEAIELLRKENIDLVFLDIQMPDITGIDLVKSLTHKPKIIFTTAHPDYALEGFNYDAVDYLLKPFSFERFQKAVDKAYRQFKSEKLFSQEKEYIFVKSGYENLKIPIQDILYIESLRDYVQVFTKEKKILTLINMKDIIKVLPSENFTRTHRSFIVALNKITSLTSKKIYVGEKEVPVGGLYKKEVKKLLKAKGILS